MGLLTIVGIVVGIILAVVLLKLLFGVAKTVVKVALVILLIGLVLTLVTNNTSITQGPTGATAENESYSTTQEQDAQPAEANLQHPQYYTESIYRETQNF